MIMTNEHMKKYYQEARDRFLAEGRSAAPISQISVQGNAGDIPPLNNGIKEIRVVIDVFKVAKIPCYLVNGQAMVCCGAGRVIMVCARFEDTELT
jgi:putative component of toxin-antitoxin plasmid stabilization module